MENQVKSGTADVYQGTAEIGKYPYEITETEQPENSGFLYVGDRAEVLSALIGEELSLHLEDGTQYKFSITDVASKMGITVRKRRLH